MLAFLAALPLALAGCRALSLSQSRPPAAPNIASVGVTELVKRHNRNARLVQSLQGSPQLNATGKLFGGAAETRLALSRPRDFRLSIFSKANQLADFGSNTDQYWLWAASKDENKEYYVGRYDEHGGVAPGLIFETDWVVEALGLRLIPDEETGYIQTEKGDDPRTLKLVHHRGAGGPAGRIKKTVVDKQSGLIRLHEFYAPDGKTLLARAYPSEYRATPLPQHEASGGPASVVLPYKVRIVATPPDSDTMDLTFTFNDDLKVNALPEDLRTSLFVLPSHYEQMGYVRRDLDELNGSAAPSLVRETRPAPTTGARVRLDAPVPIGADDSVIRSTDPRPLAPDLPASTGENELVRARLPRPPGHVEPAPAGPSQLTLGAPGRPHRPVR